MTTIRISINIIAFETKILLKKIQIGEKLIRYCCELATDQYKRGGGNMKADAALHFWVVVCCGFFAVGSAANTTVNSQVAKPTSTVNPTPSSATSSVKVAEAPKKSTVVEMDMKITKTWSADYNNQSSALFKNLSRDLYAALNSTLPSHGLVNVTILSVKQGSIIVTMRLYFLVPSSTTTNIEEVIKKDKDNKLSSFGVDLNSLKFDYPEVKLGDWKPKSNECATKCCDGAGGSIALERTCEPSGSCGGISLKKTSNSCTSYCKNTDCNSGTLVKASISTFILAALALIRTLA